MTDNKYLNLFVSKIIILDDMIKMYTTNNDKFGFSYGMCLFSNEYIHLMRGFSGYEENKLPTFHIRRVNLTGIDFIDYTHFTPDFEYNPITHNEEFEYYYLLKKNLEPDIIKSMEELAMLLELKK